MSWISWFNCALGAWLVASPWIYGYAGNRAWSVNSVTVGVYVLGFGIASAMADRMKHEFHGYD